jgi:hypothetical protein
MIVLSGGPALDGTDPCTVDYVASVEETETEVRVTVSGRSPEARETYSCQGKSYPRELQITLSAPLGERRLIETQFDTEHPVFDTASLLSPQPLPDGWTRLYEGPGPDHVNSWSQAWGPAESPTSAGLCTSSPEMLRLTQGPKDIGKAYPATGAAPAGQYEVGGRKATLYEGPGTTLLIWSADASGYVLETSPKCDGGAQDTADALLTFANSLH